MGGNTRVIRISIKTFIPGPLPHCRRIPQKSPVDSRAVQRRFQRIPATPGIPRDLEINRENLRPGFPGEVAMACSKQSAQAACLSFSEAHRLSAQLVG